MVLFGLLHGTGFHEQLPGVSPTVSFVGQSVNKILIFFYIPPFLCKIGAVFTVSLSTNNKTLFSMDVHKYIIFENKICSKKFLVHFCTHHILFCFPGFPQKFSLVTKPPHMLRVLSPLA
jgi:hypothetical protein